MPIYEYDCRDCGRRFEQLIRRQREQRDVRCPACGGSRIERRPSVFAAHAASQRRPLPQRGCARCGDPRGPCALE